MDNSYHNNCGSQSNSSSSSVEYKYEMLSLLMLPMFAEYDEKFMNKLPMRTLSGHEYITELVNGRSNVVYELFRMDKETFIHLCNTLKQYNYIDDSRGVTVKENMTIFLFIVGHNVGHRVVADRFQHSLETINRHFKTVMRALNKFAKHIICPSIDQVVPPNIRSDQRFCPSFKKCIEVIDGTHISAWAPTEKTISYRGRKSAVTKNVMCVCSFNMKVTYMYSGWECTTIDSRVFWDALIRSEVQFPWPTNGKYYLVDSSYPCTARFLPLFRGERYHLNEYQGRTRHQRVIENYLTIGTHLYVIL